ncbi:cytochrome c3 family protein [Shewanella sp. SNU WT4]|uniref:cytochrome c3 family protein n=1 Tax=Shewanella sp. SNU WT4 TaxID=2590015 RepID=UPI001126C5D6|nr:cytochrome c3 family protein [Shewanella sp. SNU WT4]QDF66650.1 cytochrome c3 family protein [Shewanella sp. SNU WT4]
MKKLLTALVITLSLGSTAQAGELFQAKGKIFGRDNHSVIYDDKNACKTCHASGLKSTTDTACIECHGTIDTIKIDTDKLVNSHANPHQSVHYAEAISCLACHSEHQKKAPLCSECHRTWFTEM